MRLVRYGPPNAIRPGMLDRAGRLRDLSYVLIDIDVAYVTPDELDILRAIEPATLPPVDGTPALHAPTTGLGAAFLDGAPAVPLDRARAGIAAVVGAPRWSGAFLAARLGPEGLTLGPWLTAPDRPLRPDRLRFAGGGRPGFARTALRQALDAAAHAAVGDLVLLLAPADALANGEIDGFGPLPGAGS